MMKTFISLTFHYIRSFIFIFLCLYIGNVISHYLPIPIPGSIIGLLILFALLATHIIPPLWVKSGCQLFIRYMAVLFIPASVGIMDSYPILLQQFGPIVIACLASTFIVLLLTGYLAQYIHRNAENDETHAQKGETK